MSHRYIFHFVGGTAAAVAPQRVHVQDVHYYTECPPDHGRVQWMNVIPLINGVMHEWSIVFYLHSDVVAVHRIVDEVNLIT